MDLTPIGRVESRRVVLRRAVEADPETVWRAVTSPDGLVAWLGRFEGPELGVGAGFVLWHEDVVRSSHEVLEWSPPRSWAVSWDFPGERPSRVRIDVVPRDSSTTVVVDHEGLDDPVSYAAGWHVHLDFLAGFASGRPRSFGQFWDDHEQLLERYRPPSG